MTTASTRLFDELAKIMTNAAGAAQGLRKEIDTLVKIQMERVLGEMDLVKRDEFEAVKEMAANARTENEALAARLDELTSQLAALEKPKARKAPAKKTAKKPAKK